MSDETILGLFDDVSRILERLQSTLSCLTTSDTGSDPTEDIQDAIKDLRDTLTELPAAALPQPETPSTPGSQTKKDLS